MFIAFEGIEGSGKSTQSRLLAKTLKNRGFEVVYSREPGGCALGDDLRKILLDSKNKDLDQRSELFMYLAARAQHVKDKIMPAVRDNKIIIVDRFNDSTIAYQGYGRGLDTDFVYQLCDFACYGLWPDITIVLDMPVEIGIKRARLRNEFYKKNNMDESRFEQEELKFHERVREGYLDLQKRYNERIVIIDATGSVEEIGSSILSVLKERLGLEV